MRIQRLRIGLEVLNKINGKRYKVTNINGANGVGTAHEMITDSNGCWSGKFGKDETVITDRNALAFRILNDPEPYPVAEGYSVMNGKLLKNGMPACEAGELIFTGILAVQRDFVILAAKKNGTKEGRAELMSYQVSRDRFTWLYSIPENTTFAGYIGEDHRKAVLVYSSVEEKEQEDKNGSLKKARIFGQAGLMVIMAGMVIHHYETDAPITMEHVMVKEIPDGGGRFTAFLPFDEKEDDNGCLAPRGKRLWLMTDGERQTGTFEADGTLRTD